MSEEKRAPYSAFNRYFALEKERRQAAERLADIEEAMTAIEVEVAPAFERGETVVVKSGHGYDQCIANVFRPMVGDAVEIEVIEPKHIVDLAYPSEPDFATADAVMSACGAACSCFDDEVE